MIEKITLDCSPEAEPDNHPKLGSRCRHGLPGALTELASEKCEADPAALLATTLTFAGAEFGANKYITIGETKHYPRLYTAIVGNSSKARKGTSTAPIERIFKEAEEVAFLARLQVTPGPFSTGEGVVWSVRDEAEDCNIKTGKPLWPAVLDKRVLAVLGEFGATLASMSKQNSTLSAALRTLYDSGNYAPQTKHERTKTTNAHVSFIGHITKLELSHLLTQSDIYNGMGNRILWVSARRSKLIARPTPMDSVKVTELARKMGHAIKQAQAPGEVCFDDDAAAMYESIYPELSAEKPGIFGVITARSEAHVIRLALIYALLDCSTLIRTEHLLAALDFWNYCEQSSNYLFGKVEANPRATKLLNVMESGPMTKTEIHSLFNNNLKQFEITRLLAELETDGKIISQTGQHGAATTYAINRVGK